MFPARQAHAYFEHYPDLHVLLELKESYEHGPLTLLGYVIIAEPIAPFLNGLQSYRIARVPSGRKRLAGISTYFLFHPSPLLQCPSLSPGPGAF